MKLQLNEVTLSVVSLMFAVVGIFSLPVAIAGATFSLVLATCWQRTPQSYADFFLSVLSVLLPSLGPLVAFWAWLELCWTINSEDWSS